MKVITEQLKNEDKLIISYFSYFIKLSKVQVTERPEIWVYYQYNFTYQACSSELK